MLESWLALVATDTPALPAQTLARWYLRLGWGLALAAWLAWALAGRSGPLRGWRRLLPLLLLLGCLLPQWASPAHFLGLAFRAPSLTLTLWAACVLAAAYHPAARPWAEQVSAGLQRWAWALVALGGLLVLDALALLPAVQLYAWGFAPAALGLLVALAGLPWLLQRGAALTALLWLALLLHVALRLPSGNPWDALLDPWLALILLYRWLQGLLRR